MLCYFSLPSMNIYFVIPNVFLLGFFTIPIIPIGYSFSVELTYPISEIMSNGIMMMFS
jgi:hypothetical protein